MVSDKRVLVVILNNTRDFERARDEHWYRIPVKTAPKRWESEYLAFYQTKIFGDKKWAVHYFAPVRDYQILRRIELLPEDKDHPRAQQRYFKVQLEPLQLLGFPIVSKRWRRIVFIPTTWTKFNTALEVNDLFDDSPLEDKLWLELKKEKIEAERQFYVGNQRTHFYLDFAIFCRNGLINIECDGDRWHSHQEIIPRDNARNNFLTSKGWQVLRFSSQDLNNNMPQTIATIRDAIHHCQGIKYYVSETPSLRLVDASPNVGRI